jgi:hypothetical protein
VWNFMAKIGERIWGMNSYRDEGWDAYLDGYEAEDNPYDEGTYAHTQWEIGWTECEDEYSFHEAMF